MKKLKGFIWLGRNFGWRRAWRYERVRRSGLTILYNNIFSESELQAMEDAGIAPWLKET